MVGILNDISKHHTKEGQDQKNAKAIEFTVFSFEVSVKPQPDQDPADGDERKDIVVKLCLWQNIETTVRWRKKFTLMLCFD